MAGEIKADGIILDVDGTIWDTTPIVSAAWNEAIEALNLDARQVDSPALQREFGKTMQEIADDLWPNLTDGEKRMLMAECCKREQSALKMLNTKGRPLAKDICFEGVVETVKSLCRLLPFFIVSNCQKGYIELVMEKTGLSACITDYECYGNTGLGKAENIAALTERNHLLHPLYVGDTQGDGAACAKAGITFVWASYGFGRNVKAEHKIESFGEIASLLETDDTAQSSYR